MAYPMRDITHGHGFTETSSAAVLEHGPFQLQNCSSDSTQRPQSRLQLATRIAQAILYVVSITQLTIAFIATCVFFTKVKSQKSAYAEFSFVVVSVLMSNAFFAVCGGLGLAAASGRSRVVMVVFVAASLVVFAMSCILINGLVSICHKTPPYYHVSYFCGTSDDMYHQIGFFGFFTSDYRGLLANEGLILTFAILGAMAAVFLLFTTYVKRNNNTL